jgi:hypothetical protein
MKYRPVMMVHQIVILYLGYKFAPAKAGQIGKRVLSGVAL